MFKNNSPLKLGKYVLRNNQLFYIEEKKEEYVCDAVLVENVFRHLETGKVELELNYWSYNRWDNLKVSRGKLVKNELPFFLELGMDVAGYKAKYVFGFIDLHEKHIVPTYTHNKLGWAMHEGELIFKHYHAHSSSDKFSKYGGAFQVKPKGKLKEWIKVVKEEVIGHTPLELMLCGGFSAALVGLFNVSKVADVDTLIFHLGGNSTTGKTTTAMLAVSPFGNPSSNNNGLIQSFNGTKNAMVGMIAGNYGVPLVFDESSMTRMGENSLSSFIYEIAQNRDKARLDKEANLRETNTWATTIISTGEHSIIDKAKANEGLRMRLFEFMNTEWTKDADNSNNLKEVLMHNYGLAGLKFIKHIQEIGVTEVISIWEEYKNYISEKMPDSKYQDRVSSKFAMVLTAGKIANESMELGLSIEKIADMLVEQEMKSMSEREMAPKFYQQLKYQLIINKKNFKINKDRFASTQEIWGKIEIRNGKSYCYILPPIFDKQVKELGYSDSKILLNELKKMDVLQRDKNKHKTKKAIYNKDEIEQRTKLLETKSYNPKGDYTVCVVYDGDIFADYQEENFSENNTTNLKKRLIVTEEDEDFSIDEM